MPTIVLPVQRPPSPRPTPTILQPATPTSYNFRFAASKEFKQKFERLAEVLGIESPRDRMAELLERAVDFALDKKDPKRRLERRRKSRPDEILGTGAPATSRYGSRIERHGVQGE